MPTTADDRLPAELARTIWALHRALRQRQGVPQGERSRPLAQVELLRLVDSRPGITVREVSEVLRMQANNVSTLVSALARDGFLERRTDADDRRLVRLHPTPKMLAASAELADRLGAGVSGALDTLSQRARTRIAAALPDLRKLAEALDAPQ